jgi:hypothetical protein
MTKCYHQARTFKLAPSLLSLTNPAINEGFVWVAWPRTLLVSGRIAIPTGTCGKIKVTCACLHLLE